MDTKQKKPDTAGKRQTSVTAGKNASRPRPAGTKSASQTAYKPTAPQGASVYGATKGTTRRTTATAVKAPQKNQKKTGILQSIARKGAVASQSANASRERVLRAQKQMQAKRQKKRARRTDTPAVIYTEPKPFNRTKLLIQLSTVAAVVLAFVLGLSVFFKVKVITVSGAETYSAWAIREASGISEGDNLLTFSKPRASAQIRAELSYIDRVRIGIKLPDTVNIYVEELDVAYAIKDQDGIWWLITSEGRIVAQSDSSSAENYTQVLGVAIQSPIVNQFAEAVEEPPAETVEGEETIPVTITGAQRLSVALQILKALEANDIVGEAASVNVTSINSIELWYGKRYQVDLGDSSNMEYKIACMNDVILQLSDYQTGRLDISFTTWKDQVGYTPFA